VRQKAFKASAENHHTAPAMALSKALFQNVMTLLACACSGYMQAASEALTLAACSRDVINADVESLCHSVGDFCEGGFHAALLVWPGKRFQFCSVFLPCS